MDNLHLSVRIQGILDMLRAVHKGSDASSNETRGTEREAFVDGLLRSTLPQHTRLGSGEVTDTYGRISGQLDVIIEYPLLPSLPLVQGLNARIFLAENVAAVIEVKSDLSRQWSQVKATANRLAEIRRRFGRTVSPRNRHPAERIPLIAVGYTGWKNKETTIERLKSTENVDAVLDLDTELFYAEIPLRAYKGEDCYSTVLYFRTEGVDSLWGLICILNEQVNDLTGADSLASYYTFVNLTRNEDA